MKLIVAIIRPFKLDDLIVAFEGMEEFPGVTISDAEGFGRGVRTAGDVLSPLKPNKRIEIAAPDGMASAIVATIKESAHTGRKGDGFVIVMDIEASSLI